MHQKGKKNVDFWSEILFERLLQDINLRVRYAVYHNIISHSIEKLMLNDILKLSVTFWLAVPIMVALI